MNRQTPYIIRENPTDSCKPTAP